MRGKARFLVLLCVLFLSVERLQASTHTQTPEPANPPKIIYVDANAASVDDGSSWENSYAFLQNNLSDASTAKEPVYFADANLKQAVEETLGVTNPTPIDMLGLTNLHADRMAITDLTGLEYATNLNLIFLYNNQISDISPLSGLTKLNWLNLDNNQITNISPLSGLTNLKNLYLEWNQISDISPLAGLIKLEELWSANNQISDISPLSGLTNLDLLDLLGNQIVNISPLSGLAKLRVLYIKDNQIDNISPLSGLINIQHLSLSNNQISDVSPLYELTSLQYLNLNYNQINNLSPLSGLANLQMLYLENNQLSDILPLSSLTSLQLLHLGNKISYFPYLSRLPNSQEPQFDKNQISDISPLSSLTNLQELQLCDNQIIDISPLSNLTNLRMLDLRLNLICNILPLSGLTNLQDLRLSSNQVSDISPLSGLTNLRRLWLQTNPLAVDAYNIYIPLLESFGTSVSYDPLVWRTLTISSTDGGSVIEPGEGDFDYTDATIVQVNAMPEPGYYFVCWTGSAVDAGDVAEPDSDGTTVTMNTDYTLLANFEEKYIIYVDDDALGVNNGSSWSDAYNYLQDALADANSAEKPIEIRIAQGMYRPDQGAGITLRDREATFELITGVTLKGGYAGFGEPAPDVRDVELYETILTGDLAGNDGEVESPSELSPALLVDNSCRVVVADSTGEMAVLDGFTITGSYPNRDLCQRARTMMIKAGNPTVRNCHFTGVGDGTRPWFSRTGGAASLLIQDAAKPIITNCRFTENQSAAVSIDSSPIFTDCLFEDNVYALELWREDTASLDNSDGNSVIDDEVILTGCTFERTGRTGVSLVESKITLTDCTFESTKENSALGIHGGDVTLERCVFNNNTGHEGGAIDLADGILVASDCVFTNNRSGDGNNRGGDGGAIRFFGTLDLRHCHFRGNYSELEGGALAGYSEQSVIISGCTFVGNTAEYGGAISYHGPSIVISNCTFADNRGVGPAIFALGGIEQNVEFSHCIIRNGQAPFQPEWWERWVPPKVEYSDIEGGWSGIGNIDVDPFFARPGYWDPNETPDDPNDDVWVDGDYHLKSQAGRWDPESESWVIDDVTSPCIDAGDPNNPVAFEPYPNGSVINMGAYGGTIEASKSPSGIHAKYGGGSGTAEDPYLIYTAEQMNEIGVHRDDWDKCFKLMAE